MDFKVKKFKMEVGDLHSFAALRVFMIALVLLLAGLNACKKEMLPEAMPWVKTGNPSVSDRDSEDAKLLASLSVWAGTSSFKNWVQQQISNNEGKMPDEVLLGDLLCGAQGTDIVASYNLTNNTSLSKEGLDVIIKATNEKLALKFDRIFEKYYNKINEFTPVISNESRSVSYFNGEPINISSLLANSNGNLAVDIRVLPSTDVILFNPADKKFDTNSVFTFCTDEAFFNEVASKGSALCDGRIAISITRHLQVLRNKYCAPTQLTPEICNNGIDDDGDGLIDGNDPDCAIVSENCTNGIDDDGDGLIDGNDPDCGPSPCMRDRYKDDNRFKEIELQSPQVLTAFGANTCGPKINIVTPPSSNSIGTPIYPGFGSTSELEEWYDFLIKIHWGTTAGGQGQYQDLVYRFHIFELANKPDFSYTIYTVGQSGTGGGGGVAILTINSQGLTETIPASLNNAPFFAFSNVCGINNWDPSVFGDKVAISIHEFDNCTLSVVNGNTTTNTSTAQNTYSSQFSIAVGKKDAATGGILLTAGGTNTTTNTYNISSTYTTNYANEYYLGRVLYSYCWSTDGIHEVPFGNLVTLRIRTEKCD